MKKDLINITNQNGSLVVSSREVAEHFEKRHNDVVDAIENKIKNLTTENIVVENYFTKSIFIHRGNTYDQYLLTRDGFSFIVMGFTGAKADIWKLKYIEAFNKMEESIKNNQLLTNDLSPQLQLLINMELKQREIEMAITETKQEVQGIRDTMVLDHDSWRKECNNLINKIAKQRGGTGEAYRGVREEVYSLVEQRAGAKLKTRIVNKQDRMRREGTSESKVRQVSQVDVIAEDKRLKEIYIAVVKEMAIKYGA